MAAAPEDALALLQKIRKLALKAAPGAQERISYGMPAVFVDGRVLIYFSAFKEHVGVYPPPVGDKGFMASIAPYSGPKGNLMFPHGHKVPDTLLRAIIAARLSAVRDKTTTTVKAKPKKIAPAQPKDSEKLRSDKAQGDGDRDSFARRTRWPMPAFVKKALIQAKLMKDYSDRPPYQQNDYVGWIIHAKTPATQLKRLAQMLDELGRGGVYMRMKHSASSRT